MKEIAHRVHEDPLRCLPFQRLVKLFRNQSGVETTLVRMPLHSTESFAESFRIAILTARADLDAASNRVPGRICPLDGRVLRHDFWLLSAPANVSIRLDAPARNSAL